MNSVSQSALLIAKIDAHAFDNARRAQKDRKSWESFQDAMTMALERVFVHGTSETSVQDLCRTDRRYFHHWCIEAGALFASAEDASEFLKKFAQMLDAASHWRDRKIRNAA